MQRERGRLGIAFLIVVAALVAAAPAGAQAPKKHFSASVPADGLPGTQQALEVTIANDATSQSDLGSANLTVPDGFTRVRSSLGTVGAVAGKTTVLLRDLALRPGRTITFTVSATSPGCGASGQWQVAAKQANDFRGTGNDFTLTTDPAQLRTLLACESSSTEATTTECAEDDPSEQCTVTITRTGGGTLTAPWAVQLVATAFPEAEQGDAGRLAARWTAAPVPGHACPSQRHAAPVSGIVEGPPNRTKDVVLRLSPSLVSAQGAAALAELDLCAASPVTPWYFKEDHGAFLYDSAPFDDANNLPVPWIQGAPRRLRAIR